MPYLRRTKSWLPTSKRLETEPKESKRLALSCKQLPTHHPAPKNSSLLTKKHFMIPMCQMKKKWIFMTRMPKGPKRERNPINLSWKREMNHSTCWIVNLWRIFHPPNQRNLPNRNLDQRLMNSKPRMENWFSPKVVATMKIHLPTKVPV